MKKMMVCFMVVSCFILMGDRVNIHAETACIQVITYAMNPETSTWETFPTPCDVPEGWVISYENPDDIGTCISSQEVESIKNDAYQKGYQAALMQNDSLGTILMDENYGFTIQQLPIGNERYSFKLDFLMNPQDPFKFNWKLDLASVTTGSHQDKPRPKYNITQADNGKNYPIAQGDYLQITLPSNPTTGYAWEILSLDEAIVKRVENAYHSSCTPESGMVGCGGEDVWTFQAISPGVTQLSMTYIRPFDSTIQPENNFSITVKVE
ncbi:MAG: protease inhibitor I42 family protein [Desulfobacterales bacterium]|nr:protease inhibitor I42 family protein [Desulfobacterales bacterium]